MSTPRNARMSMIGCGDLALPEDPGRRSPLIAALLSLLMPGLGQVYVGRPVRGAFCFVAILAIEAAALYVLLNQPRFWLLIPIVATLIAAMFYQIVEAAVLARRSAPYSLRRYNKWYVYVALLALSTVINAALCLALMRDMARPIGPFSVDSYSMQPTILRGERFLADRNHYRRRAPVRGDVAVYVHPRQPELHYVKRIIALPGDRVAIRDGRAIVNGFALEEPYAIFGDPSAPYNNAREIMVPDGHVFVLGDNRANSIDSRAASGHGMVPIANLQARATDTAWSRNLSRIGHWIGTP